MKQPVIIDVYETNGRSIGTDVNALFASVNEQAYCLEMVNLDEEIDYESVLQGLLENEEDDVIPQEHMPYVITALQNYIRGIGVTYSHARA